MIAGDGGRVALNDGSFDEQYDDDDAEDGEGDADEVELRLGDGSDRKAIPLFVHRWTALQLCSTAVPDDV